MVDGTQVRFEVGAYDSTRPLVIDPLVMSYSTYLGGTRARIINEHGSGIAVDGDGHAYVTGVTYSTNFPTTPGAFDMSTNGKGDGFVTKLNADGSALVFSTCLGGSNTDISDDIAVDSVGNVLVAGTTGSSDYPTTPGSFNTIHGGGAQVFVTRLNASGSALDYSTFIGRAPDYFIGGIALADDGSAWVTGRTPGDFPTTPGAFDTTFSGGDTDCFLTKLNPNGSALSYSTFLGGSERDIAYGVTVDRAGNAYVTGNTYSVDFPTTPEAFASVLNAGGDGFVTTFNANGSALIYSTFLGGSDHDFGTGIVVDSAGHAYVSGITYSDDYPTTLQAFQRKFGGEPNDGFVTKLDRDGSALIYSSFLGGSKWDETRGITIDVADNVYVTGMTDSVDFPTTRGAFDATYYGNHDIIVTKFAADGNSLEYSTFLGELGYEGGVEITVDENGSLYVTGHTTSANFPTTPNAFRRRKLDIQDGFVTKFASE